MQPKSVVFPLETPVLEAHICKNERMNPCRLYLFDLFIFFIFFISLSPYPSYPQSHVSSIADRYQYAGDCIKWEEGHNYLGRHAAGTVSEGQLLAGIYGEKSQFPGGYSYFNISSRIPLKPGTVNFLMDYSGAGDLHELQTGLGYARNLGPLVQIGIRFNYYRLSIDGYGAVSAFPAELGTLFQWTPKLSISLHIYNVIATKPASEDLSRIPSVVRMGAGYTISASVGLVVEVIKEMGRPVSLQPIIFYQAGKSIFFRGGLATGNRSVFISAGYGLGRLRLDLSTAYIGPIGWTSGLGLQIIPVVKK